MSKLVWAGALALALLLGGAARAEPETPPPPAAAAEPATAGTGTPTNAAKLNEEGFALYKQRDYRRAAEKFLQAYGLEPDPNLLFNIARCYEALGDTAGAEEKYRLFLAEPDADPQGKRRAQEALRVLAEKRDQALPPTPAGAAAPAAGEPPLITTPATKESRPRRVLPTVVLGVGAAAVVAGATLYFWGRRDFNTVMDAPGYGDPTRVDAMTESAARQLVDSGRNKVIAGGVIFGLGVAALAASAALFRWTF
jgi:tetratricopeptide (TPR) repeat protein